jgi:hypothetical protein
MGRFKKGRDLEKKEPVLVFSKAAVVSYLSPDQF